MWKGSHISLFTSGISVSISWSWRTKHGRIFTTASLLFRPQLFRSLDKFRSLDRFFSLVELLYRYPNNIMSENLHLHTSPQFAGVLSRELFMTRCEWSGRRVFMHSSEISFQHRTRVQQSTGKRGRETVSLFGIVLILHTGFLWNLFWCSPSCQNLLITARFAKIFPNWNYISKREDTLCLQ